MESEDRDNDMVDLVVVDGEYGVDAETVRSVMRDTVIPDMKKCYGCIAHTRVVLEAAGPS